MFVIAENLRDYTSQNVATHAKMIPEEGTTDLTNEGFVMNVLNILGTSIHHEATLIQREKLEKFIFAVRQRLQADLSSFTNAFYNMG